MEVSLMRQIVGGNGLIAGNSSVQTTLSGPTVLCPSKTTPWEPVHIIPTAHQTTPTPAALCMVATPNGIIQSPIDIPKETIIANTDFTTTSLIAKRRLSSKKRRQQQAAAAASSSQNNSPNDHAPSTVTIATTTPSSSTTTCLSSSQPVAVGGVGHTPRLIAVPAPQYVHINNQVVPQKGSPSLSNRSKRINHDTNTSTREQTCSNKFQWSTAHVFIAHRIKQHQEQQLRQQQVAATEQIKRSAVTHPLPNGTPSLTANGSTVANGAQHQGYHDNNTLVAMLQHQQHIQQLHHQQQQLILLQQLYGGTPHSNGTLTLPPHPHPLSISSDQLHYHILSQHSAQTQPQIVGFHIPPGVYQTPATTAVPITFATAPLMTTDHTYHHYNTTGGGSGPAWITPVPAVIAPIQTGPPILPASSWVK